MSAKWVELMRAGKPHICRSLNTLHRHKEWWCVSANPDLCGIGITPALAYLVWNIKRERKAA